MCYPVELKEVCGRQRNDGHIVVFVVLRLDERSQTDKERKVEDELNELKQLFTEPILKLSRRMKRAETARELAEALYLYLEELHVPEQLDKLRIAAEKNGDLVLAREHEQSWNAVVDLLDQFVELLSEEKISLKSFMSIIESGLESLHFSLVPQAMDQVIVANLDLSRLDDVKASICNWLKRRGIAGENCG